MDITQTVKSALKSAWASIVYVAEKVAGGFKTLGRKIMNLLSPLVRNLSAFIRSIVPDSYEIIEKFETLKKLFVKGGIRL